MTEELKPEGASSQQGASNRDMEIEKVLIQQAQWIVERHESANEGLMTRSASLAGFAGIELSLVGTMVVTLNQSHANWTCGYTYWVYTLLLLTVLSLSTSIVLLIMVLKGIPGATFPDHSSIIELLDYLDKYKDELSRDTVDNLKIKKPLEQILMPHKPGDSYLEFLLIENKSRAKNFGRGFNALIGSQVLLAILVLVIYWR